MTKKLTSYYLVLYIIITLIY